MKRGQAQLVAFALLIGFAVVMGVLVGNWAIKQAKRTTESFTEKGEMDVRCADVAITPVCENGILKIKNKGAFKVQLKTNEGNNFGGELYPNDIIQGPTTIDLNKPFTVLPFIEIDGKEFGCASKVLTLEKNICVPDV